MVYRGRDSEICRKQLSGTLQVFYQLASRHVYTSTIPSTGSSEMPHYVCCLFYFTLNNQMNTVHTVLRTRYFKMSGKFFVSIFFYNFFPHKIISVFSRYELRQIRYVRQNKKFQANFLERSGDSTIYKEKICCRIICVLWFQMSQMKSKDKLHIM